MSLGKKIIISYFVILLFLAGVAGASLYGMQQMKKEAEEIIQEAIPFGNAAKDIMSELINEQTGIRGYLITLDKEYLNSYYLGRERVDIELQYMQTFLEKYPKMAELMEKAKPQIAAIQEYFESMISLAQEGKLGVARIKMSEGKALFDALQKTYEEIVLVVENVKTEAWNNFKQAERAAILTMYIVSGVALAGTILIAYFFVRNISRPVRKVSQVLESVAGGDLTIEEMKVKSRDEIGVLVGSVNKMVKDLRGVLTQVSDTSNQLAASSEELSASADQSSKASEQIAATTQQVAAGAEEQLMRFRGAANTLNEMSASIQQVAANSEDVSEMSGKTLEISREGLGMLQMVRIQMNEISETVAHTAELIRGLGRRSQEIGQIVEMITAIADQTNLLALNAAIEAARAGESGRGFAVVADEVRKLAEQSSDSAKQIGDLIAQIQRETELAINSMEEGTQKVADGVTRTEDVAESFAVIEQSITRVTEKIQEVANAIEQISFGTQKIVESLDDVTRVSQESATLSQENAAASQQQLATTEEIASSAQTLSTLAENLQSLITRFKL